MQALQISGGLLKNIFTLMDQHAESVIIVTMSEHVSECISAGITSSPDMDNDLESLFETD